MLHSGYIQYLDCSLASVFISENSRWYPKKLTPRQAQLHLTVMLMTTYAFSKIYVFDGGGKGQCAGVLLYPWPVRRGH